MRKENMTKQAGIWGCNVIGAKAGENDKGIPNVQVTVQITDGPDAGQRCTYEEEVSARTAKYVRWSLEAVGWKGQTLKTAESDVAAWIEKTGGKSTVEIKHLEIKNGPNAGKIWDKVSGIGRGAARPLKPISASSLADADDVLRSVGGAPPDEEPQDDAPFVHRGGVW
jgi:hypothetical protein